MSNRRARAGLEPAGAGDPASPGALGRRLSVAAVSKEIPLARIVAVSSAFEAMVEGRRTGRPSRQRPHAGDPPLCRDSVRSGDRRPIRRGGPPPAFGGTGERPVAEALDDPAVQARRQYDEPLLGHGEVGATDNVTLLYSHRHLLEYAEFEAVRARRRAQPFAVVMVELCDLERINGATGMGPATRPLRRGPRARGGRCGDYGRCRALQRPPTRGDPPEDRAERGYSGYPPPVAEDPRRGARRADGGGGLAAGRPRRRGAPARTPIPRARRRHRARALRRHLAPASQRVGSASMGVAPPPPVPGGVIERVAPTCAGSARARPVPAGRAQLQHASHARVRARAAAAPARRTASTGPCSRCG